MKIRIEMTAKNVAEEQSQSAIEIETSESPTESELDVIDMILQCFLGNTETTEESEEGETRY